MSPCHTITHCILKIQTSMEDGGFGGRFGRFAYNVICHRRPGQGGGGGGGGGMML